MTIAAQELVYSQNSKILNHPHLTEHRTTWLIVLVLDKISVHECGAILAKVIQRKLSPRVVRAVTALQLFKI